MPNVSRKESAKAQNDKTRFCLLFVDIETVKKNDWDGVQFKKKKL